MMANGSSLIEPDHGRVKVGSIYPTLFVRLSDAIPGVWILRQMIGFKCKLRISLAIQLPSAIDVSISYLAKLISENTALNEAPSPGEQA